MRQAAGRQESTVRRERDDDPASRAPRQRLEHFAVGDVPDRHGVAVASGGKKPAVRRKGHGIDPVHVFPHDVGAVHPRIPEVDWRGGPSRSHLIVRRVDKGGRCCKRGK